MLTLSIGSVSEAVACIAARVKPTSFTEFLFRKTFQLIRVGAEQWMLLLGCEHKHISSIEIPVRGGSSRQVGWVHDVLLKIVLCELPNGSVRSILDRVCTRNVHSRRPLIYLPLLQFP